MNRKFNLSAYMHVLLSLYVIWFMTRAIPSISEMILGLGLIGFCIYQQYLERLKLLENIRQDYANMHQETKREIEYLKSRVSELDEVKKLLISTKSIGSISSQTSNTVMKF